MEKYKDAIPIETNPRTVYQIRFEEGEGFQNRIVVCSADCTILEAHGMAKNRFPDTRFTINRVDAGSFIADSEGSYTGDGRRIDQDLNIILG